MPIPTLITELSQTIGSNYPAGSEAPSVLNDYAQAHAAFIAQLRDGKNFADVVTLASATTTDVGGQNSLCVEISGTTTITGFGTNYNGPRLLRFTAALTLTHSSTLSLPGAANITTMAGDTAIAVPNIALNGWVVYSFQRATALRQVAQVVRTSTGAIISFAFTMPYDDTIPQLTEGGPCFSRAITPVNASSTLEIDITVVITGQNAGHVVVALFQDATANALASVASYVPSAFVLNTVTFKHTMTAGTTSATTFYVRAGTADGGTLNLNGTADNRLLGGVSSSSITITEILP